MSNLNLEEGVSKGMKKVKIDNVGLGTRRALPDSKLNGKLSQNSNDLKNSQSLKDKKGINS